MKYKYTDIAITDDGDLILGPPKLDINNDVVSENGKDVQDMYVIRDIEAIKQIIEIRFKNELGDMFMHPNLTGSLKPLIGKRNTRELANQGKKIIVDALTYGGFIDIYDVKVLAIPANESTIVYHIELNSDGRSLFKFDILCDLENGIRRL